jgi:aspartate kinase
MEVFKFGGASVKDAGGIRNLGKIVLKSTGNLVIVVSAFGKTTNALETVLKAWLNGDKRFSELLGDIYKNHLAVINELFENANTAKPAIDISFSKLNDYLLTEKKGDYDYEYDQIVSYGEIWSTIIVAAYLKNLGLNSEWIDIRKYLITDDKFRDANVLWVDSIPRIKTIFDFSKSDIYITQGFIGGTVGDQATTLGREGSDYTAAILANMLDAEKVVVWKDVRGILNADPKWMPDGKKLDGISYKEAVEMTFSGAKVIHPKTIKPLHNKNIPLHVKSFLFPEEPGTIISSSAKPDRLIPIYIKKENQILISILPKDLSFILGDHLSQIFHVFMIHGVKVNLVHASAVSIDVCVDDERSRIDLLINDIRKDHDLRYNEMVEMLTIRHYDDESVKIMTSGRKILIEQRTQRTVRFVVQ